MNARRLGKAITYFVILAFMLASCTSTSATPHTPIPILTPPTFTLSPTSTQTPTSTATVIPTPLGAGGYFFALNTWKQVVLVGLNGQEIVRTNNTNNQDFAFGKAIWSSNGRHLTFVGYKKDQTNTFNDYGLYSFDATDDFTNLHQIVSNSTQVGQFAWSPNEEQLAYITGGSPSLSTRGTLFLASPPNYEPIQLTDYGVNNFAWSPDGKFLAISAAPPTRKTSISTVYILNLSDPNPTPVRLDYQQYNFIYNLSWSPNGEYISFTGAMGSGIYIYSNDCLIYDVKRLKLIRQYKRQDNLIWSPDGSHFVLTSFFKLVVRNLYNDSETELDLPQGQRFWPVSLLSDNIQWSPNGEYIAYVTRSDTFAPYSLHVSKADGSENRTLLDQAPLGEDNSIPDGFDWSPDSRHIVFIKYEGDQYGVYIADVGTWNIRRLFTINETLSNVAWQPVSTSGMIPLPEATPTFWETAP